MAYVPEVTLIVPFAGFPRGELVTIERFLVDRYEVTNKAFMEFVEAGGYQNTDYWAGLSFADGDQRLSWEEVRARLVDSTGRPGPSTWRLGRYPEGTADYPVSGVSWYEAVAYSRFREKSLPTIYHWVAATHGPPALSTPMAPVMVPLANLNGRPLSPVGASESLGMFGTYDNAGNVREWIWNEGSDGQRWILGGGWQEADYAFTLHYELPPLNRSELNGIRLMQAVGEVGSDLLVKAEIVTRDFRNVEPVSDEGYALLREDFGYDRNAVSYELAELEDVGTHRWQKVTITPTAGEPFDVHLFFPASARAPYQTVVFFPPRVLFISSQPTCEETVHRFGIIRYNPVLETGRAVVMPVWSGACERYDNFYEVSPETRVRLRADHIRAWHEELGRTLDYLETRDDIKGGSYGFYGVSYGGSRPLPVLALEERLTAAVLYSGGFPHGEWPQISDAVNYAGRTTLPVLMLAGRFDAYRPVETAQRPLLEMLATPADSKKMVVYDAGHYPLPATPVLTEIANWFDRHLGPIADR